MPWKSSLIVTYLNIRVYGVLIFNIKNKKQRVAEMIELCGLEIEQHKKIGAVSSSPKSTGVLKRFVMIWCARKSYFWVFFIKLFFRSAVYLRKTQVRKNRSINFNRFSFRRRRILFRFISISIFFILFLFRF